MMFIKYFTLFTWAIILLGAFLFLISHGAVKRKLVVKMNLSVAIYLSAVIFSFGIVFLELLKATESAYDTIQMLKLPNPFWYFLRVASSLSGAALILMVLAIITSKFFSALFFGFRNDLIEFESDHMVYAIIRSALVLICTVILIQLMDWTFQYLSPQITTPFYR